MNPLDHHLFNIKIPTEQPSVGSLLVAEPFLKEAHFNHAVISLIDHESGQSSMGVVLNRPTNHLLNGLIDGITTRVRIPVYCGGPMSYDRLYFIHTLGDIISNTRKVSNGLYVGGDFNDIIRYINSDYPIEGYVRFFLGYCGWSPGQLEQEINDNVWAVTTCSDPMQLLTGLDEHCWYRCVQQLGDRYRGWLMHPRNPQAN